MKFPAWIWILPVLLLGACAKKEIANPKELLGLDYFPVQTGHFVIYDVDSTVFIEIPKDTLVYKYRLKIKIADAITDNEGKTAYRLERYVKWFDKNLSYDSMDWRLREVWMLHADDKNIVIQESNIRFVKLIFPVQENTGWNGNAENTKAEQGYFYKYIEKTEEINNTTFDKVLMVSQAEQLTLINESVAYEKYAKGRGLVEKHFHDIKSNQVVPGKSVAQRIESGLVYHQSFVSHGIE